MKLFGSFIVLLILLTSCAKEEEELQDLDQMVQVQRETNSELAGPSEYEQLQEKKTLTR
jgi:hypothetical protein